MFSKKVWNSTFCRLERTAFVVFLEKYKVWIPLLRTRIDGLCSNPSLFGLDLFLWRSNQELTAFKFNPVAWEHFNFSLKLGFVFSLNNSFKIAFCSGLKWFPLFLKVIFWEAALPISFKLFVEIGFTFSTLANSFLLI